MSITIYFVRKEQKQIAEAKMTVKIHQYSVNSFFFYINIKISKSNLVAAV